MAEEFASMIQPERVRVLHDIPLRKGRYVLYWMQQAQRAHWNHALEYAVRMANDAGLPVRVGFGLDEKFPEANLRHFTFMLEGLKETAADLHDRGIGFTLRRGRPARVALDLAHDAALMVCDRGYLRHQRDWRETVAKNAPCRVVQVESDAVVPVETASGKAEIGARTIRPRIRRQLDQFMVPLTESAPKIGFKEKPDKKLDIRNSVELLQNVEVDTRVGAVSRHFPGGRSHGLERFQHFLSTGLTDYAENSRRPEKDATSKMSPWLHFGQISPLELALQVRELPEAAAEAFLEQLVVRRELAVNFTFFNPDYDTYACVPAWARESLASRGRDAEGDQYSMQQLLAAETSDPYWNAAMREMLFTGFMHTYMRMYWGKKILEWTRDPGEAFQRIRELNNRFFLDGRDPNSFAGVAWIFGVHDRAWPSRPGFGKVRSMTASGLERKCDIATYVSRVNQLELKS